MPDKPQASELCIRRATSADADGITTAWIHGLGTATHLRLPPKDEALAFFEDRLNRQTETFGLWVAEHQGTFAGWQGLQPCRPNPVSKFAESSTYVSSAVKAKGVGRALIMHATEHSRHVGLDYIVAFIRTENIAMIRIVESCGWSLVGRLPRGTPSYPEYLYYAYAVPAEPHEDSNRGLAWVQF
jgi:phosphinothricin acetyltransferase